MRRFSVFKELIRHSGKNGMRLNALRCGVLGVLSIPDDVRVSEAHLFGSCETSSRITRVMDPRNNRQR